MSLSRLAELGLWLGSGSLLFLSSQMALYATERFLAATLKVPVQEPS